MAVAENQASQRGAAGKTASLSRAWNSTPKLSLADVAALLWRERILIVGIGAAIGLVGLALALMMPRTYAANAEVLVRLGQEYVYQPRTGGAGAGAAPKLSEVLNSEIKLAASQEVTRRMVVAVGPTTLYPDLAKAKKDGAPLPAEDLEAAALEAAMKDFSAGTAPETPTIVMSFRARTAELSAQALNAHLDAYLAFRREVLVGAESGAYDDQRVDFEKRLTEVSETLARFLQTNQIGDFERELTTLGELAASTESELFATRARLREMDARASSVRSSVEAAPSEIELYSESDAQARLTALRLEREQLLARYQQDAAPVREIDRRIFQTEAFLENNSSDGTIRRGPNPVRQEAETQLVTLDAEARAQRDRVGALQAQAAQVSERLRRLQELEPTYRALARDRAVLEENARSFASRAEEVRAFREIAGQTTDNISVVERATPPSRGHSLRFPVFLAALFLAGVAALTAGLVRGFLRNRFPTPGSAARTLDTPVLAVMTETR
jgi:uncharacterized protein involved in exopolysaccharide biosynthesis